MPQKNNKDYEWENVKMRKEVLALVRKNKEETFVPIIKFVEIAVLEKLKKQKK
jgi:hypothetical protein